MDYNKLIMIRTITNKSTVEINNKVIISIGNIFYFHLILFLYIFDTNYNSS